VATEAREDGRPGSVPLPSTWWLSLMSSSVRVLSAALECSAVRSRSGSGLLQLRARRPTPNRTAGKTPPPAKRRADAATKEGQGEKAGNE
jgi:hypothetical protein